MCTSLKQEQRCTRDAAVQKQMPYLETPGSIPTNTQQHKHAESAPTGLWDCACPKRTPNYQGLSLHITPQHHANSATPPLATPKATSTDLWGRSRNGRGVLQRASCFSKQLLTGSIIVLWVISDLGQKSLDPDQQRERHPLSLRPYHSSHGSEPGTCRTAVLLSGCTDSAREARATISLV